MPRVFELTTLTPLPSLDAVLKNYENKIQLNKLLSEQILADDQFLNNVTDSHVLVATAEEAARIQVYKGQKSIRVDLVSSLEEADSIIVQQVVSIETDPNACVVA